MSAPASELSENATSSDPHFSLLRMSAGRRALGACVILAVLWVAVWWAL
jgi:hypothetical protein